MQTQAPASIHCKLSSAKQQNSSYYGPENNIHTQHLLSHVSSPSPTFYDVVQQQNNITAQLLQQQALDSLPPRRILEFDGDPLRC